MLGYQYTIKSYVNFILVIKSQSPSQSDRCYISIYICNIEIYIQLLGVFKI
jgi:hypothetical protein